MSELEYKQQAIQKLLEEQDLEALVLQRACSFAWATDGAASYINLASSTGESLLVITPKNKYIVTNNIESPRLKKEENLQEQGWEFIITPWYHREDKITDLTKGLRTGADNPGSHFIDISESLARARAFLSPYEGNRFRDLGRLCAEAMNAAAHSVQPGQTEYEIAGLMAEEVEKRGIQITVNLVGTDERIFEFRHPLPTAKKLKRYAMLVFCGRWKGLVCSITRLLHFGPLSEELRDKSEAVARIDANFIHHTRPGKQLGMIFQSAREIYTKLGYPGEWENHHQGGPAGYEPREYLAVPDSPEVVSAGQVFAWNPSITGAKSEDTILVGEYENEILTAIEGWPAISIEINGKFYQRPDILVVT